MERTDRKLLFFDIDGTLWDRHNHIPKSTREAFELLRKNGHYTFINSGRSRGFIFNPDLFSLGFDGVVSACGTRVDFHDDVIFYHDPGVDLIRWALDVCREFEFSPILEGPEFLYMNPEEFPDDAYVAKISRELGPRLKRIDEFDGKWSCSKFSISSGVPRQAQGYEKLSEHFKIITHTPSVAECVPLGFDKGTGIAKVCELLNYDIKDTFAFGDGNNDIEMLVAAGTGICMGDGYDKAREASDYVTTELMNDGIKNACLHFGLI